MYGRDEQNQSVSVSHDPGPVLIVFWVAEGLRSDLDVQAGVEQDRGVAESVGSGKVKQVEAIHVLRQCADWSLFGIMCLVSDAFVPCAVVRVVADENGGSDDLELGMESEGGQLHFDLARDPAVVVVEQCDVFPPGPLQSVVAGHALCCGGSVLFSLVDVET